MLVTWHLNTSNVVVSNLTVTEAFKFPESLGGVHHRDTDSEGPFSDDRGIVACNLWFESGLVHEGICR